MHRLSALDEPCGWEGDEEREGLVLAANLPTLIISKALRWLFYQKHAGYYQQISQNCFKMQALLHPGAPKSNS